METELKLPGPQVPAVFKSHHSGMETYQTLCRYGGQLALNRTIVGWKLCDGVKVHKYALALNRTIVGWKQLEALHKEQTIEL